MKKIKKFLEDLIFSAGGLIAMNACISFLVYPVIRRTLGDTVQGQALFFVSLANLVAGSFGSAANYGRMKIYAVHRESENGDSNWFLLFTALASLVFAILAVTLKKASGGAGIFAVTVLCFATSVRMYADVEYRLSLDFKKFSLYYVLVALGYAAGVLLFLVTRKWILIFLFGEAAGILTAILRRNLFTRPLFKRSALFKENFTTDLKLSASFFLSDLVGASDRFLFPLLITGGDSLTAVYYSASVIGKMMSLLSTPLNGVLNGYISRKEGGITRKTFIRLIGLMVGIFMVVTALSVAGSVIFVRLFYPEDLEKVRALFLMANAGQVIFFICNTLMVIVLRYTEDRNQVIVNVIYIVLFFAVAVPMVKSSGLWGMARGILMVNTAKFLLYAGIGFFSLKGDEHS